MGITIQQLSVFLENREGRLDEVLSVLAGNDVNIVALSLADTTEYGMLRMIVSDPNKGKAVLKENGITAMLTDVIALRVPHETGSLSRAMHQIVDGDVNIEYMYAFANGEDASAVLKCDDPARVVDILRGSGFDVWEASEAYVSGRLHRKQPLRLHGRKALAQYSAQTRIVPLMIVCEGIRIKAHDAPFAAIVYRGKGDVKKSWVYRVYI